MDRPLFDVEKRVIAEGKTIQVTPDLLLALNRLQAVAEYIQSEAEGTIDPEDSLDLETIICDASADLFGIMEEIYKHLDKNYLDAFIKEYCEQDHEYQSSIADEDQDEDEI